MNFANHLKKLGDTSARPSGLSERDAYRLFGAMLDGGMADLELGAFLFTLRGQSESITEMLGFYEALHERLCRLRAPDGEVRPVVFPSYGGARKQPDLLPLLALLLQRFGVPVLIHGSLNGEGCVASAYIFRELGVMPSARLAHAQEALDERGIAFVPTAVLAPGLGPLLSLRARLGVSTSANVMAELIDPFESEALRVAVAARAVDRERLREFLLATAARALLLRGTEGEPYADPRCRPQLEYFHDASAEILFEAQHASVPSMPDIGLDAVATSAWIKRALNGEVPIPLPIVNQLACCLLGSGCCKDINQAKALVSVETGSLVAG